MEIFKGTESLRAAPYYVYVSSIFGACITSTTTFGLKYDPSVGRSVNILDFYLFNPDAYVWSATVISAFIIPSFFGVICCLWLKANSSAKGFFLGMSAAAILQIFSRSLTPTQLFLNQPATFG